MSFNRLASRVTLGLALVAGFASGLAAQRVGVITGRVIAADSTPVVDAEVSLEGSGRVTRTDADGRFRFASVQPGAWRVHVDRVGYRPAMLAITVGSAEPRDVTVVLAPAAVDVAAVTVIGTREDLSESEERLQLIPGSVKLVEAAEIRATRQANFKDVLRFTPGVWVQPRFGAADESQLSIRGSGLRNNFHLRGVNLLVNGMPYRNADGFTDFESLELATTEAIEVYKGGNALRYGGSTLGGAVNLVTETGYTVDGVRAYGQGGSYGFYKAQLAGGARRDGLDWYASYARTGLDGYRDWSDQQRDRVNLHAGYALSPALDMRAFYFYARVREHLPGSLTQAQMDSAPTQADPGNVANRWGRDYALQHVGLQLRSRLGTGQRLEISPYFQYRDIDHPIFRVLAQISRDFGVEARYENANPIGARTNRLTLGVQQAAGNTDNRHYDNVGGSHGALRKDQRDVAGSTAAYFEDVIGLAPRLSAVAGLRWERARREVTDFFLTDGDQSGERTYEALLPKVGVLYDLAERTQLYANASRSFEPPLLLELNSLTVPGFVNVAAQRAWQYEVGTRGRSGAVGWDVSLYDVELNDEILNANVQPFPGAPFTVPTYRNAARTRHYGLEAGLDWRPSDRVSSRVAYTFGRYTYVEDTAYAGNDIPGAPRHVVQAEVEWRHPSGFSVAPNVEWVPAAYFVNSTNTASNEGWTTFGLRAEYAQPLLRLTIFAAVQNLTNVRYAGSVSVDNGTNRFYEPADGRAVYAGLRWHP